MKDFNPSIFKAYDIRGIYGVELDEAIVYAIAQAYSAIFKPSNVVLGRDVRQSGPSLWEAAKDGFIDAGVNVVDIGVISTDMLYFAVAEYNYDGGITISASHNPKEYNGVKMVRQNAQPISSDNGIFEIRDWVSAGNSITAQRKGSVEKKDISDDYSDKVLSFLARPLKRHYSIIANASFGVSGLAIKKIIERGALPITLKEVNFELDGTFSKGSPNPLLPESIIQMQEAFAGEKPDFGVVWDADADRCFIYDEKGTFILGYYTVAVLAHYFLQLDAHSPIITNESVYLATKSVADKYNAKLILHRTGHSFIKATMRKENCSYAGEVSGHYYFRDFYFADNGMIPLMIILNLLDEKNVSLSELYSEFCDHFFVSGEINTIVKNSIRVIELVKEKYQSGAQIVQIDGVSFNFPDWRFNLRPSNTEPLIRLNVESMDKNLMEQKTHEVQAYITSKKDIE